MAVNKRRSYSPQEDRILNLVRAAVNEMERGKGVSRQKILEHVQKSCKGGKKVANAVKIAITKALDTGILERTTGSGLNGSFRLSSESNRCQLVSFTPRDDSPPTKRSRREKIYRNNVISFKDSSAQYNEEFHLKAILKSPRSHKASGFRVKFSVRGPKICWISPLPDRKRTRRLTGVTCDAVHDQIRKEIH